MSETRRINDTFYLIDVGFRRQTPVALVEKTFTEKDKEYIIAIDYKVENDRINWGYGYYYDKDIKKAKEDFAKVLEGKELADTFAEKEYSED